MTHRYVLQISPEAKSAYFADSLAVCAQEFSVVFPERRFNHQQIGTMDFVQVDLRPEDLKLAARMSWVQGIYQQGDGDALLPLPVTPEFQLPDDFVFGSKFKGKTNERLTQLLINLGLSILGPRDEISLLDPMCGRATSLIWAMRYGISSWGIEYDPAAIEDVQRILKKWCKLHRVKHKMTDGFVSKKNKSGKGRFIDFRAAGAAMKMVTGDAKDLKSALGLRTFDMMISDLPYGVQHAGPGGTRNPIALLEECAPVWNAHLNPEGVIVLAFNANNPKRASLCTVFEQAGFSIDEFAAPHRMSESILRDIVILRSQ